MAKQNKIAQIKWACRRGMLELDFILNKFLEQEISNLSESAQDDFLRYLENADPDLYSWLMGYQQPDSEADIRMTDIIRNNRQ